MKQFTILLPYCICFPKELSYFAFQKAKSSEACFPRPKYNISLSNVQVKRIMSVFVSSINLYVGFLTKCRGKLM